MAATPAGASPGARKFRLRDLVEDPRILRMLALGFSSGLPLLLVLGTSSSEAALPSLMEKMEAAGCRKAVVGLVVPTGYSFNLDGTNIYMTLAALFIAQAVGVARRARVSSSRRIGCSALSRRRQNRRPSLD